MIEDESDDDMWSPRIELDRREMQCLMAALENETSPTIIRLRTRMREVFDRLYDPAFGDEKICACGDPYYRHFDTYDGMAPVGCKYCPCWEFKERQNDDNNDNARQDVH